MARNVGVSIENAFNRGLITEVTGVNSPENSVTETLNIIYDRRGKAVKRGAFNYEMNYLDNPIASTGVYTEYVWKTISSNIGQEFVVVQIGSKLYFFESNGTTVLSRSRKTFTVNLLTYKTPNFTAAQVRGVGVTYTTGRGYLFVAHPYCDPIFIKYNSTTDNISVSRINIQIRDFEGIDDPRRVDQRPSTLTSTHKYNLYNQGWYTNFRAADSVGGDIDNVLDIWSRNRNDWPSNVDVWWYYVRQEQGSADEYLSGSLMRTHFSFYGNTPAPKGHYIINAFQSNRSALSGIANITESSSGGLRPGIIAFYAGRVFYASVGKSGFSSLLYFSQIIERDEQLGRCYQANDPTSREIFDLLDSDGGVIDIQDINTVYGMRVVGNALIVFASNGVWSISGTDNGAFKATDYSVTKITSEASISNLSIVDVSGSPIWWNYEGVFSLKTSETGLTTDVTSLSVTSIQTFYDQIPQPCKPYAKGVYNNQDNTVYWLYSTNASSPMVYNRILILDAVSMAFYVFSIPEGARQIRGVISLHVGGAVYNNDLVVMSSGDDVIVSTGDQVMTQIYIGTFATETEFRFITTSGVNMTFSEIRPNQYLDWGDTDYEAYFITGYRIRGEVLKSSQTNYLTVIMETLQNSSCYVQGIWDYANSPNSGRFANPQQAYRQQSLYDYQMTRLKMRGTGKTLQFKFIGVTNSPMVIIGWAGYETANGAP